MCSGRAKYRDVTIINPAAGVTRTDTVRNADCGQNCRSSLDIERVPESPLCEDERPCKASIESPQACTSQELSGLIQRGNQLPGQEGRIPDMDLSESDDECFSCPRAGTTCDRSRLCSSCLKNPSRFVLYQKASIGILGSGLETMSIRPCTQRISTPPIKISNWICPNIDISR